MGGETEVSIQIDGPVMVTPVAEPEPEPKQGMEAVWVVIGLLAAIGLYLRFG